MLQLKPNKQESVKEVAAEKTYEDGLREAWEFSRFVDATYKHGLFNVKDIHDAMKQCENFVASN